MENNNKNNMPYGYFHYEQNIPLVANNKKEYRKEDTHKESCCRELLSNRRNENRKRTDTKIELKKGYNVSETHNDNEDSERIHCGDGCYVEDVELYVYRCNICLLTFTCVHTFAYHIISENHVVKQIEALKKEKHFNCLRCKYICLSLVKMIKHVEVYNHCHNILKKIKKKVVYTGTIDCTCKTKCYQFYSQNKHHYNMDEQDIPENNLENRKPRNSHSFIRNEDIFNKTIRINNKKKSDGVLYTKNNLSNKNLINMKNDAFRNSDLAMNCNRIVDKNRENKDELKDKLLSLLYENAENSVFSKGQTDILVNSIVDFKNGRNDDFMNIRNIARDTMGSNGVERWRSPFYKEDAITETEVRNYLQGQLQMQTNGQNLRNKSWNVNSDTRNYRRNCQGDYFMPKISTDSFSNLSHMIHSSNLLNVGRKPNRSSMSTPILQNMATFNISDKERERGDNSLMTNDNFRENMKKTDEDHMHSIYEGASFFSEANDGSRSLTKKEELSRLINNLNRLNIFKEKRESTNHHKIDDGTYGSEHFASEKTGAEADNAKCMQMLEPNYISSNGMSLFKRQELMYKQKLIQDTLNKDINYKMFDDGNKNFRRMFNACFLNSEQTTFAEAEKNKSKNEDKINGKYELQWENKLKEESKLVKERQNNEDRDALDSNVGNNSRISVSKNKLINAENDLEGGNANIERNQVDVSSSMTPAVQNENVKTDNKDTNKDADNNKNEKNDGYINDNNLDEKNDSNRDTAGNSNECSKYETELKNVTSNISEIVVSKNRRDNSITDSTTDIQKETTVYDKILMPYFFENEKITGKEGSDTVEEKESIRGKVGEGDENYEEGKVEKEDEDEDEDEDEEGSKGKGGNGIKAERQGSGVGVDGEGFNKVVNWVDNKNNLFLDSMENDNCINEKNEEQKNNVGMLQKGNMSEEAVSSINLRNGNFDQEIVAARRSVEGGGTLEGGAVAKNFFDNVHEDFYKRDILSLFNKNIEVNEHNKYSSATLNNKNVLNTKYEKLSDFSDIFLCNKKEEPFKFVDATLSKIGTEKLNDIGKLINYEIQHLSRYGLYDNNNNMHFNRDISSFGSINGKEIEQGGSRGRGMGSGMGSGIRSGMGSGIGIGTGLGRGRGRVRGRGRWRAAGMGLEMGIGNKMEMRGRNEREKEEIPFRQEQNAFNNEEKWRDIDNLWKGTENNNSTSRKEKTFYDQRIQHIDKEENKSAVYFKKKNVFSNSNSSVDNRIGNTIENKDVNVQYQNLNKWNNLLKVSKYNNSKETTSEMLPNINKQMWRRSEDHILANLNLSKFNQGSNAPKKSFLEEIDELKRFIEKSNTKGSNAKGSESGNIYGS